MNLTNGQLVLFEIELAHRVPPPFGALSVIR